MRRLRSYCPHPAPVRRSGQQPLPE